MIDCLIGNEEDFQKVLGFEVEGVNEHLSALDTRAYKKMVEKVVKAYPNLQVVGTTLREVQQRPGQQLDRDSLACRHVLREPAL